MDKILLEFGKWIIDNNWTLGTQENSWFRPCQDSVTPEILIEYTEEDVLNLFKKEMEKEIKPEKKVFIEDDLLDFLGYVEDYYYYNSGAWYNRETGEHTLRTKILELFKNKK